MFKSDKEIFMSMTEAQLLVDLLNYFLAVSPNPRVLKPEDDKLITSMAVEVVEIGTSQKDKKPIGIPNKSIEYFVYKRGQAGLENAYYLGDQPANTSLKDVTISSSSYDAIASLYYSTVLRNRVLSAIITQCSVVFQEGSGYANHANRMKLVNAANNDLDLTVKKFMSAIALNAAVQAAGTAIADSTILAIISGSWDSYASLIIA